MIDLSSLLSACADSGADAGITITTELEPLSGPGTPAKPAVYEGGIYQLDTRWVGPADQRVKVPAVVIDNVASQANRLEAALRDCTARTGLPELVLDLSGLDLPQHLPSAISSFDMPHRNADAYLRDSELDGVPFLRTPIGQAVFGATPLQPEGLLEYMPQALLYGFWQSHLGKKREATKLARAWTSEIVGYDPAAVDTKIKGLKGDQLNLSTDRAVDVNMDDQESWSFTDRPKEKGGGRKEKLSDLGHGQVPTGGAAAPVSFAFITQQATVSFARLRTIHADSPEASAAGRALLVAIGLLAHVEAFGRPFTLRSGCDLRATSTRWRWLGPEASGDQELDALDREQVLALFQAATREAERCGLPVGTKWPGRIQLQPQAKLISVIRATWDGK